MSTMEALTSDIKRLGESLNENLAAVRAKQTELEQTSKVSGQESAEIRETLDKINEEFVSIREEQKRAVEKLARMESIRSMTDEACQKIEQERMSALMRRLIKGEWKDGVLNGLKEEERNFLFPAMQTRALGSLFDSEGGALIPLGFEQQIYKTQFNMPGFRQVVTARPISTLETPIITMGSISGEWLGEAEQTTAQDTTFGNVTVKVHDLRVEVPIPNNLLEDSAVDLVAELTDSIAMKLAEMEDIAFISGNGVKKPTGLFTNSVLQTSGNYVATGVAANIYDSTNNGVDAMRLMPVAIKQTHRQRGSWMMSAQTEARVRNLKDAYGQYLYHTNVQAGKPNTFDGYAVNISDNCPAIAANAFPIAFGDFNGAYAIRDRQGLTVTVDSSVYRRTDKTAIYVKKRVGGEPIITSTPAVCLLKVATS